MNYNDTIRQARAARRIQRGDSLKLSGIWSPPSANDGPFTDLWAFVAAVRVEDHDIARAESRTVRGLLVAHNANEARARANEAAERKARELGRVIEVSVTRLW